MLKEITSLRNYYNCMEQWIFSFFASLKLQIGGICIVFANTGIILLLFVLPEMLTFK